MKKLWRVLSFISAIPVLIISVLFYILLAILVGYALFIFIVGFKPFIICGFIIAFFFWFFLVASPWAWRRIFGTDKD